MVCLKLCEWTRSLAHAEMRAREAARAKRASYLPRWMLVPAEDRANTLTAVSESGEDLSPEGRLRALLDMLDRSEHIGYRRSMQQRKFHKAFVTAILPKIFGSDLYKYIGRLMKWLDITDIRSDVLVLAIRRSGKTTAVAIFAAAVALTIPDMEVSIYSTCLRTSRKLMVLIWKIAILLAGTPAVVVRFNADALELECCGTISKINSLPATVQIRFFPLPSFSSPPPPTSPPLPRRLHQISHALLGGRHDDVAHPQVAESVL